MPPKRKEKLCNDCSRCKLRTSIMRPTIKCGKSRPDFMVLASAPSSVDDKFGVHFSDEKGGRLFRETARHSDLTNYVVDSAVRCFSQGQPTEKAVKSCTKHWMATLKKHNPKTMLVLGKYAAEAVMGKRIQMDKVAGQSLMVEYDGVEIPTIFNYDPGQVVQIGQKKGGAAEKADKLWYDSWDILDDTIKGGLAKRPKTRLLKTYKVVNQFLDFLLKHKGTIAFDYETHGDKSTLRPELCKDYSVLSIGVGYNDKGVSFPLDYPDHFTNVQKRRISTKWTQILMGDNVKVAHNAKFEHKVNIHRFGYTPYLHDTMLMMNVINELAPCSLGVVGRYFGFTWSGYKVEMSGIQQKPIETPIDELLDYNGLDALLTYKIFNDGMEKFDVHDHTKILKMKQRYAMFLARVEMSGMYANMHDIPNIREELIEEKGKATVELYANKAVRKVEKWCTDDKKENGDYVLDKRGKRVQNIKSFKKGKSKFNPKSPTQMKRLCLSELKLPVAPIIKWKNGERTKSYSFDKRTLEQLEDDYPFVKVLNKIRSIDSMFSGFLDKYENFTCPNSCVHTNYNQVVVLTGRLSSTEPNLQNIPENSPVKRVFASRFGDDGEILSADYKQIEPRILAGWSEDVALCEALNGGFDLHRYVASKIFDVEYNDVTHEQRQLGKRMNLGQMYGQTPEGLAKAANISLEHAKALQNVYFQRFPGIKKFRVRFHKEARRSGLSVDLFGGTRHLPNAQKGSKMARERAERQASNFPIQSTANHFCLIGLCRVMELFEERGLPAILVGTVHDSIIVDYKKSHRKEVIQAVNDGLLIHNDSDYWGDKPVPMAIDISIGPNYKKLVDLKEAA